MSFFANLFIIALLQLLCIIVSFFLPELLFRLSGKDQRWHVPAASSMLIVSVLALTGLYGAAKESARPAAQAVNQAAPPAPQQTAQAETPAAPSPPPPADEPATDFSITTRFGTLPMNVGATTPLELAIVNNGAATPFSCELAVLNGEGTEAAPQNSVLVDAVNTTGMLQPDASASCAWRISPRVAGVYVLQPSVAASGSTSSQQVRIEAQAEHHADVTEQVWVFNSRSKNNGAKIAAALKKAGFLNAIVKGEWKTRSEEQYIFYRDVTKKNLDALFVEIGDPSVQPYYYNSERVGAKVKELFEQNPDLGFLVIIH